MKKILVVDDDHSIVEVIQVILEGNGFNVRTNLDGHDLPKIINEYQPDLILLDIRLPGNRLGTEICKELKQVYFIPIILFSAEHQVVYKDCNADDFIQKPFEIRNLLFIINTHLMGAKRA
jgi:DNA-binding response OmpR family regulator